MSPAAVGEAAEAHLRHTALAGLALGLLVAGALPWAGPAAALGVLGVLALLRAPRAGLAAAALVVAGAGIGQARIQAIDAPGERIDPGDAVRARAHLLTLPRPGPFGDRVEVRALDGPARGGRLVLRMPRGRELPARAGPGAEVRFAGVVRRGGRTRSGFDVGAFHRRRGIAGEVTVSALSLTGGRRGGVAGAVDRLRERAQAGIANGLPPPAAALARGMVLGQDELIEEVVRDEFRASGLAHVLAVSGQNVMLLAALALPLLAAAGLDHRARIAATIGLIAVYVPLAGAGPSLQRAGVMGVAALVALAAARPSSRWYSLLLAACATLALNPRACGDPGWQLSFAAVVGILTLVPLLRRPLAPLPRVLAEGVAVTVAATVATAPLMAHHFDSVSLAGLPANVLALPLVAPIMWLGMVKAALGLLGPAGLALDDVVGLALAPLLSALGSLASAFATMPGGQFGLPLGRPGAVVAAYAGLAALAAAGGVAGRRIDVAPAVARWRRARPVSRRGLVVAVGLLLGLVLARMVLPPAPPSGFTVSYLDVGQGDATLIQAPGGIAVLFDGGPPEAGVARQLRQAGVRRLSLLVATHQSRDHHAGLQQVVERFPVDTMLENGDGTRDPTFTSVVRTARAKGARIVRPVQGQRIAAGPVAVRILGPPSRDPGPAPEDPNPRAIAAVVSHRGFDLFLSGDAESEALAGYDLPPVEAMKVSHHGSADPGLPEILTRLRPKLAGIEVGADNTYGHPTPSTLRALRGAGARVYRTDRDGTVRLRVRDDASFSVETAK